MAQPLIVSPRESSDSRLPTTILAVKLIPRKTSATKLFILQGLPKLPELALNYRSQAALNLLDTALNSKLEHSGLGPGASSLQGPEHVGVKIPYISWCVADWSLLKSVAVGS